MDFPKNILIIEDERLAAEQLTSILEEILGEIHVLPNIGSVFEAVRFLKESEEEPDLIFLDVELRDGKGFEIFSQVSVTCPIIFCTAYDHYALEAFKVKGIDYLLKPISTEKVMKSLEQINKLSRHVLERKVQNYESLLKQVQLQQYKVRFLVKKGRRLLPIPVSDISYFYSKNTFTFLVAFSGDHHVIDFSLEQVEELLDPSLFFRVNRQIIASHASIIEMEQHFKSRVSLKLDPAFGERVIVSSVKTPQLKNWMEH